MSGIFRRLREHEYDPELMRLFVVGGGGCMIKHFGRYDPDLVLIIDDICATASSPLARLGRDLPQAANPG